MLLFGGKRPRVGSVLAGMLFWFLIGMETTIACFACSAQRELVSMIFVSSVFSMFVGAPLGYIAGVLVAGVFLPRRPDREEIEDRPTEIQATETQRPDEESTRVTGTDAGSPRPSE